MHIVLSLIALSLVLTTSVHAEETPFELQTSLSRTHISPGANVTYLYAQPSVPSSGSISIEDADGNEIKSLQFDSAEYFDLEWDAIGVPEGVYTFIAKSNGLEERKTLTVDATPPVITLAGETLIHHPFETPWSDPGVSINEGTLTKETSLSVSRLGTSTVTYSATDKAGNRTQVVRTILIEHKQTAITLSNLTHTYDDSAKSVSVQTSPKVEVYVTYNGSEELPVAAGTYAVHAQARTYGYEGSADATFTIAEAGSNITVIHTEVEKVVEVAEKQPEALEEVYKILSDVNSFNLDIEELQRALIRTGHLAIPAPTGIFGPLTQTAVRFYQLANKLPATGYVDAETLSALEKEKVVDENVLLENLKSILGKVEELASTL